MVHQIIITCSTDGRLRVFVNEKQNTHFDRINEEDEAEFEEDEEEEEIENFLNNQ